MTFSLGNMYRNIYRDKDAAFTVDEIISQTKDGVELIVTWYKKDDNGRYVSMGFDGEFYISGSERWHYVLV